MKFNRIIIVTFLLGILFSTTGCRFCMNYWERMKGTGLVWQDAIFVPPDDLTVTYIGKYVGRAHSPNDLKRRQVYVNNTVKKAARYLKNERTDLDVFVYTGPEVFKVGKKMDLLKIAKNRPSDIYVVCYFSEFPGIKIKNQERARLKVHLMGYDREQPEIRPFSLGIQPFSPYKKEFIYPTGLEGNFNKISSSFASRGPILTGLTLKVYSALTEMFFDHKIAPVVRLPVKLSFD